MAFDDAYDLAYREAVRALEHQYATVSELRGRASMLLAAASITVSLPGAQPLDGSQLLGWVCAGLLRPSQPLRAHDRLAVRRLALRHRSARPLRRAAVGRRKHDLGAQLDAHLAYGEGSRGERTAPLPDRAGFSRRFMLSCHTDGVDSARCGRHALTMTEEERKAALEQLLNPSLPSSSIAFDYGVLARDLPPRRTLRERLRALLWWRRAKG
jgi:hypothetical protein